MDQETDSDSERRNKEARQLFGTLKPMGPTPKIPQLIHEN